MDTLFILAALPRTGSSLLCDYLASAGIEGGTILGQHWGETVTQITERVNRHAPIGVIKPIVQHMNRRELRPDKWLDALRSEIFPHREIWYFLDRRSKLRQVLSYERALVFDEWLSTGSPKRESLDYRYVALRDRWRWMAYEQLWWDSYFETRGIKPERLIYEDWSATPQTIEDTAYGMVSQASRFLSWSPSKRVKQSGQEVDELAVKWRRDILTWNGSWEGLP
jgi:LPS sulfotransferase NodH